MQASAVLPLLAPSPSAEPVAAGGAGADALAFADALAALGSAPSKPAGEPAAIARPDTETAFADVFATLAEELVTPPVLPPEPDGGTSPTNWVEDARVGVDTPTVCVGPGAEATPGPHVPGSPGVTTNLRSGAAASALLTASVIERRAGGSASSASLAVQPERAYSSPSALQPPIGGDAEQFARSAKSASVYTAWPARANGERNEPRPARAAAVPSGALAGSGGAAPPEARPETSQRFAAGLASAATAPAATTAAATPSRAAPLPATPLPEADEPGVAPTVSPAGLRDLEAALVAATRMPAAAQTLPRLTSYAFPPPPPRPSANLAPSGEATTGVAELPPPPTATTPRRMEQSPSRASASTRPTAAEPLAPTGALADAAPSAGATRAEAAEAAPALVRERDAWSPQLAEAPSTEPSPLAPSGPALAAPAQTASAVPGAPAARAGSETAAALAVEISRRLEARQTRFEVALTPEGLGGVQVSVTIGADGALSAAFTFDRPQAAAELNARAPELRQALQQAGFDLGQSAFSFDARSGGEFAQEQRDHAPSSPAQSYAARLDATAADDAAVPWQPPRAAAARGLDLRI